MEPSWERLANSVALLAQASGVPGVGAGYQLIKEMVGIEDQQAVMLGRIQRDVKLLREGPFSAAQLHLRAADRNGRNDADYETHLREAQNLLFLALGQSATADEKSVVAFNLALVEAILGNAREAQHRIRESYSYCVAAVRELASMSNDIKYLKSRWEIFHPVKGNVAPIRKAIMLYKAANAATALEEYLSYVNNVAEIGNTMDPEAMQPGVRLLGNRTGHYELEWTTPQYWQIE